MSFHVTCMHTEQLGWVTSLCLPQLLNSWINAYVWNRAGLMSNHSLRSSSKNCSSLKEELIPWRHWSLASYSETVSSCVVMSKSGQEAEGRKDCWQCQSGNPKQGGSCGIRRSYGKHMKQEYPVLRETESQFIISVCTHSWLNMTDLSVGVAAPCSAEQNLFYFPDRAREPRMAQMWSV